MEKKDQDLTHDTYLFCTSQVQTAIFEGEKNKEKEK